MFTKRFWRDAAERALKTAGQFGVTALGVSVFTSVGELLPAYQAVGLAGLFGASLSVLTSVASYKFGDEGTASVVSLDAP